MSDDSREDEPRTWFGAALVLVPIGFALTSPPIFLPHRVHGEWTDEIPVLLAAQHRAEAQLSGS